jgi:hypothetical protein
MQLIMETRLGSLVAVTFLVCGCVETPAATEARAAAHAIDEPTRVATDDFWLDQQIAAFQEKPVERPRSISLGFAGDTPLSGGVMRDTPINFFSEGVAPQSSLPQNYGYAPPGYR